MIACICLSVVVPACVLSREAACSKEHALLIDSAVNGHKELRQLKKQLREGRRRPRCLLICDGEGTTHSAALSTVEQGAEGGGGEADRPQSPSQAKHQRTTRSQ